MKAKLLNGDGERTYALVFDKGDEVVAELQVHAHVVVGKDDGTAWGGHLLEGHVWPTLELVLVESPAELRRTLDEETQLPLIRLD